MVYPRAILERMVAIAKEFDLFIICDEIYMNIIYNEAETCTLAEVITDVPAISLKGISKEFPWPGARCGWAEYYNRTNDPEFMRLCETIDNAKMIEVSSTKLPQRAIPKIMTDSRYSLFLEETRLRIGKRSKYLQEVFGDVSYIKFNQTNGAFYNTMIFEKGALKKDQSLAIADAKVKALLQSWITPNMRADKRFVYYLLAAKQVCVVPISSFSSNLLGFRITLLEQNEARLVEIFSRIKAGIIEYCES
jgi:aspartate/methionine/tyrosine aminotransferase